MMIRGVMKKKNIASLEELIASARKKRRGTGGLLDVDGRDGHQGGGTAGRRHGSPARRRCWPTRKNRTCRCSSDDVAGNPLRGFSAILETCASLKFFGISGRLADQRKCLRHQFSVTGGANAFPAYMPPGMNEARLVGARSKAEQAVQPPPVFSRLLISGSNDRPIAAARRSANWVFSIIPAEGFRAGADRRQRHGARGMLPGGEADVFRGFPR